MHFVVGSSPNESPSAAEAEKLIDKNYIIENSAVDHWR
jgi:hypothetical protein